MNTDSVSAKYQLEFHHNNPLSTYSQANMLAFNFSASARHN